MVICGPFVIGLLLFYLALGSFHERPDETVKLQYLKTLKKLSLSETQFQPEKLNKCAHVAPSFYNCIYPNGYTVFRSPLKISNSSIELKYLMIRASTSKAIAIIQTDSVLSIVSSVIVPSGKEKESLFSSFGGSFQLRNISLEFSKGPRLASTFMSSSPSSCPAAELFQSLIFVEQSSFSFFTFSSSSPLLGNVLGRRISMDSCDFQNVTSIVEKDYKFVSSSSFTRMRNCIFNEVTAPFDGGITDGIYSTDRFVAQNCTFSQYYEVEYAQTFTDPQKFLTNNTIQFEDCLFTVAEADALYIENAINVTINKCLFANCTGMSIKLEKDSYISITESKFCNCTEPSACGASISSNYVTRNLIKKCTFHNSTAYRDGGAIHLNLNSPGEIVQCFFHNCSEIASYSTYGGGAMWIGDTGLITISDCEFSNCQSNQKGGAILFSKDGGNHTFEPASIKFCFFDNNTATQGAHDVGFLQNWTKIFAPEWFVECRTMTDKAQRIMNDTNNVIGLMKFGYFEGIKVNFKEGIDQHACGLNLRKCKTISFTRNVINLSNNSPTIISVDPSSYVESNYEIGSARIEFNNAGNDKVTVASSMSSGALFAVSTGSLKISSFDIVHDTEKSSKATSLFLLSSTGTITLQNCNISVDSGNTEANSLEESLFVLRGGSANIEGTTINPIVFASKAVITFSEGCNLVLNNSTFLGVLRQSGSGGGIEGVVGTGKSFQIKGGSMNGCVTGSGNGGGMALRTKADSSIKIIQTENGAVGTSLISCTSQKVGGSGGLGGGIYLYVEDINGADLELKGTTFSECSASIGNNIFVDGYNLSQIVTKENFEIDFNESDFRAMEGFERSTTAESYSIPLVTYLRTFNGTVYVAGSDGHDYSGCGFSDSACASIEFAIPLRFGNRERQFYLLPPFAFERALAIDEQPTTFTVEQTGVQVRISEGISGASGSIIRTSKDCSFSGMCFLLPSSFAVNWESAFHCYEKNLTLTDCSFASDSNLIGISIGIVSKGCMSFRQFALNGLTFSTRSVFVMEGIEASCICENMDWTDVTTQFANAAIKVCNGASLEIRNSQVNGMNQEESSFIEVIDSATINMNSTTLKSVQRKQGNGGATEGAIKGGKTMTVWNCTLEQCVCKESENTYGGGLNMEVENSGTLTMSNNTVKGCCVNESVGVGGGFI